LKFKLDVLAKPLGTGEEAQVGVDNWNQYYQERNLP
jgi:hypothetical protein